MTTRLPLIAFALSLAPGVALAAGNHAGGHPMAIGMAAHHKPSRTVEVTMRETDDGAYVFEPADLAFTPGETVRLHIVNAGETEHEFVMDTPHAITEHKALMEKFPEMEHDDPNAVRLGPGEEADILWTFGDAGAFAFACLLPGHYEAGMHGTLDVK
ncbi:cupredoxin family protein [Frigidibacter sp. MR17.14]|uniref:cupredoxin domain-containing protein n=1 Tax=Frigidibacter sp. MR17.14 TaxID=3126509 RepID=UPI003012BCFF